MGRASKIRLRRRGAKPLFVLSFPPKIGGSRGLKEATVETAFAVNCKVRLLRLW